MNHFLGYLFLILAVSSSIFNILINIRYQRQGHGSSGIPIITAFLGTLAVFFFRGFLSTPGCPENLFFKETGFSSGSYLLIFFGIFILDIFLGAYSALLIHRLFKIQKKRD
ncbi:MAG: hypothetical protein AB1472_00985 [Candidatus Omnitrophota bacterium]